ncbi:MAG: histidine kinase [Eubacteriales bacterium]
MQLKGLVIINIFIIIAALIVIGILVFSTISTTLNDQFIYSNQLVLENGADLIEDFIKDNKDTVLDVAIDPEIQQNLDAFQSGKLDIYDLREYTENNWTYRNKIKSVAGFMEIYPYRDDYVYVHNDILDKYIVGKKEEWMTYTIQEDGAFYVESCDVYGTPFVRISMLVRSRENWPQKTGIIAIYVKSEVMLSLFYNMRLENTNIPYLVNTKGEIILPYENTYNISEEDLLNYEKGWWKRGDQIIINTPMTKLDWKLIGVLPENELMEKSNDVRNTFVIVGGIVVLFLILISVNFSVWITKPINNLAKVMSRVEEDEFKEIEVNNTYDKETKQLYKQYNYMIRRINSLIDKVYLAQIKEKEAELLALQQQINPHFLYNTLDSIAWMSMEYKAEDIRYMVMSLASMMRYSLNEGNNYISVRDELEQVRNYLGIQEIRYDNKFTTTISAEKKTLDYKIIKLIIQPLVENAIVHGFKDTGVFGNIEISVALKNNNLVIKVINDGIEIDLEKVKKLLEPDIKEKPKHYGLRNVNDRLIKSFGKGSAIKFSVEDKRTVATILISIDLLKKGDTSEHD